MGVSGKGPILVHVLLSPRNVPGKEDVGFGVGCKLCVVGFEEGGTSEDVRCTAEMTTKWPCSSLEL